MIDEIGPETQRLLAAWRALDTALAGGFDFDQDLADELRASLAACAIAWRGRSAIPRLAVNVLVDIFPAMEDNADRYGGAIGDEIRVLAFEVQDDIRSCVAFDE